MSASWLITDGFSGEAGGVDKIVTIGLYAAAAPVGLTARPANWLSPSPSLYLFLFTILWRVIHGRS